MEEQALKAKIDEAIWVAHSLFDRGKTSGSTANISFLHGRNIYISCTGSSFATLSEKDFSVLENQNEKPVVVFGKEPSKELPLHWLLYKKDLNVKAIIHTHSFYSVLWSCLKHQDPNDIVPQFTPYLRMKVGKVKLVAYGKPGSKELFQKFEKGLVIGGAYLLQNHGPVVGGRDVMNAFYKIEELEDSMKVAWFLHNEKEENLSIIAEEGDSVLK